MTWVEVLVTRTSDWNFELFAPSAWPTDGMISDSGRGVLCDIGDTGVTTLTETGTLDEGGAPLVPVFIPEALRPAPLPEAFVMTTTVPVFVPIGKVEGSEETRSVMPSAGIVPLAGATLSHGSSTVAVKLTGDPLPGRKSL